MDHRCSRSLPATYALSAGLHAIEVARHALSEAELALLELCQPITDSRAVLVCAFTAAISEIAAMSL